MLWADLISAGTAEGRSSGSILILLALHRPTMQPSHFPTLLSNVIWPAQGIAICSLVHDKLNTPALPGRVGEVSASVAGRPSWGFCCSSKGQGCMLMCSEDQETKSHLGLFPATLHLQPRMVCLAKAMRNCPCQALQVQKKTCMRISDGTNEQHALSLIHLPHAGRRLLQREISHEA